MNLKFPFVFFIFLLQLILGVDRVPTEVISWAMR